MGSNKTFECNMDTLVGPTHHFGGHSFGNIASIENKACRSNPKKAALQGLQKMKLIHDLGVPQIILPPPVRPDLNALKNLGFYGTDDHIVKQALEEDPLLLMQCSSSSSMWTANLATVAPSCDSIDKKVHITVANLSSHFHRSLEAPCAYRLLSIVFAAKAFVIHPPLASTPEFADEGAANHIRFCPQFGKKGLHLFAFGRSLSSKKAPTKFPARQTLEASEAISRLHRLNSDQIVFAQQNPQAIDAGVFHNDVISTGHLNAFLVHEHSFLHTDMVLRQLKKKADHLGLELNIIKIHSKELSLKQAVQSYFFNSQLITPTNKKERIILIAPLECKRMRAPHQLIERLIHDPNNPIDQVIYVPLEESMKNGGGPACLRLRLELTLEQFDSVHKGVIFSENLYKKIGKVIEQHYSESFDLEDLRDKNYVRKLKTAYMAIYRALNLSPLLDVAF